MENDADRNGSAEEKWPDWTMANAKALEGTDAQAVVFELQDLNVRALSALSSRYIIICAPHLISSTQSAGD